MDIALLILLVLLAVAVTAALWKGRWELLLAGLKQAGRTMRTMWARFLLGLTLGGLIQVVIPSASIAEWLGPDSGLKGVLIGSYTGLFWSGGPYVVLPVIVAIFKAGAGPGPVIALMCGGMLAFAGLFTWDIPLMGVRMGLSRYLVCLFVPPVVGLAGGAIYVWLGVE